MENKRKTTHGKSQDKKKGKPQRHSLKAVRFHRRRKEGRKGEWNLLGDAWSAPFVELLPTRETAHATLSHCEIFKEGSLRVQQHESFWSTKSAFLDTRGDTREVGLT